MLEARWRRVSSLWNLAGAARKPAIATGIMERLEDRRLLSALREEIDWRGHRVEVIPNSWVVTFAEELSDSGIRARTSELAGRLGVNLYSVTPLAGRFARFTTRDAVREGAVDRLRRDMPSVVQVQPDHLYTTQAVVPNDTLFNQQWGLSNTGQFVQDPFFIGSGTIGADVKAPEAWQILQDAGLPIGSPNVAIAVVDTGVDLDHPDLINNIWTNPGEIPNNGLDDDGNGFVDDFVGWDFGDSDNNPNDLEGHGTAVAGVIAGFGNNNLGVTGVGWNLSIVPVKIADRFGRLSTSAIVGAHNYLATLINQGYNIVASNNSYGGFRPTFYTEDPPPGLFEAEQAAIQAFLSAGGTFVAAAGNNAFDLDNPNFTNFPSSYNLPGIISVAATDPNDALAVFSNYGAQTVDIGAPGVGYYTTAVGGGYDIFNGTSCASPVVAGAVGLLKTLWPAASAVEIRQALINSADPSPSLQGRMVSGGRLNIAEAMRILGLEGPVVRSVDPGPVVPPSVSRIVVTFSEAVNPALVSPARISLVGASSGVRAIDSATLSMGDTVLTITPVSPLSADRWTLTLDAAGFKDPQGNFLNGNTSGGANEVYAFEVRSLTSPVESNDTLATATPVAFGVSGTARFTGMVIGDGIFGNLDVDIYRLDLSRGGLITARVDARNLPTPSPLDSYLRLFDARGVQMAANDQFNGADAFLDFFVTTAGTYYIGVSGFPNSNYNPNAGGSGLSQSRGTYDITISADLVADDRRVFSSALLLPVDIPDSGQYSNTLVVNDDRLILDVNVTVSINHAFVGDVRLTLISPSGTSVVLLNRRGGNGSFQSDPGNPVPALFDDEATNKISLALPPFSGGTFQPESALSAFDGESAQGSWRIVAEDLGALTTGQFISWSLELTLQNDIFGPFELNDTLTTARALDEIVGIGSATRAASIGDGAYGVRDVDLYRFSGAAGATLTAVVTSGGVNSALRLFDAQGVEIKFSNPAGESGSSISGFVLTDGGTYYIGVSETLNVAYDPFRAGNGPAAGTTGGYTLSVQVTPGVSDGAVILAGDRLRVGVGPTGALGQAGTGIRFANTEFLFAGQPAVANAYFGLTASGYNFRSDGPGQDLDLPLSMQSYDDAANLRVVGTGIFRGMTINRAISFSRAGDFFVIDIALTNTTGTALFDVAWMEAFNPQQGLNNAPATATTANDVLDGSPFAIARYTNNAFSQGLSIALAAPHGDARAMATVLDPLAIVRDPQQILNLGVIDPNGATSDQLLALAFDIGLMNPGDVQSLRYFVFVGTDPAAIAQRYADLNSGAGTGHLSTDAKNPANDTDGYATLPYNLYYPEGYANARTSTFVPVVNLNAEAVRVVILARYANGDRDSVLFDGEIEGNSRGGITITNPAMYAADTQLVRKMTPYALEVRSSLPVAATMSHFDFGVSTGESFSATLSQTWTFAQVTRGNGFYDFIVLYNPTGEDVKVDLTLFGAGGTIERTITVGAKRRAGWNLRKDPAIPVGSYGVLLTSFRPITAAVSSYNNQLGGGFGALAVSGTGSTRGVLPEGQFGLSSTHERVQILNVNPTATEVAVTFGFANGSAYRHVLTVAGRSSTEVDVTKLPNFPRGQAYGVSYESAQPVSVSLPTYAFGEGEGSAFASAAYTFWAFGDGFRPAGNPQQITEYLRVYNPSNSIVTIEIELRFNDGEAESFRRTVNPGRITEFDVHEFVQGSRAGSRQFYGITLKAAEPVVAYIGRADNFFAGAFGSLMTPFGIGSTLS